MRNIERGSIKYLVLLILFIALFGLVLYPLFDFIESKFISHAKFVYSCSKHVIQPIIFAFTYGIVFWAIDKKRNK